MGTAISHVLTLLASRVATRGAQVFAFFILARGLAPEGFGAYGVLTSAVFLGGQLGNLGLRQAAAFMIGKHRLTDGEVIATLCGLWPALTLATTVGVWWVSQELLFTFGSDAFLAICVAVAATLLITLLQGVFLGRGEMGNFGISDTGPRIVLSALAVTLAVAGQISLRSALWIFAASFALTAPLVVWLSVRHAAPFKFRPAAIQPMVRYGLLFAVSMFLIALNTRIGLFVVQDQVGTNVAGLFFAGQRINELFLEFATVVGLALFSRTARSQVDQDAIVEAARVSAWMFWLFLAIAAIMLLITPVVINVFLGPVYAGSTKIVKILAIGLAPAAVVKVMNGVTAGAGRPYLSAAIVGGGLCINCVITLALVSTLPGDAPAIGLVTSQVATMILYIIAARLFFNVPIASFFVPRALRFTGVLAGLRSRLKEHSQ